MSFDNRPAPVPSRNPDLINFRPVRAPQPYAHEGEGDAHYGAEGEQIRLSELIAKLRRQKWLMASCALAGIIAGLVITKMTPPSYRARTSLQLDTFHDNPLMQPVAVSSGIPITVDNYLQNQVKLLESETLARRVSDRLGNAIPVTTRQSRLGRLLVYFGLRGP